MSVEPDIETKVRAVLNELDAPYEVLECDPEYADTAAFCERYGYSLDECVNTILVASRRPPGRYAACIVQGDRRLDVNRTVRRLMGVSKVSFASAEVTVDVTGMMIGGVTPFALPAEVPVYLDEALMALDTVILGSGSRSSKIRMAPDALRRLSSAQVVPGLSMEPAA